jgi:uncharacterized protein (DUF2236 family)
VAVPTETSADRVVTRQRLLGSARRWRRFGEPVPAGGSMRADGSPDHGIFGPDSVVWEVLLHPATIVFQFAAQGLLQATYKPIVAGVRDRDPLARDARKGTLTVFEIFERGQRNSGMHAPMWLGDTETAQRMARHLHNIHKKVAGDVIDVGRPELGGYAASEPRDAMWAALTEMHSMLWLYESFAFRDGRSPHRLSPRKRDRFVAEVAEYCRLVGAREDEIPTTTAELAALYAKYDDLFGHSDTLTVFPDTGEDFAELVSENIKKNFHRSQLAAAFYALVLDHGLFRQLLAGAVSGRTRRSIGMSPRRGRLAVAITRLSLPLIWLLQQKPFERHYMRLMWGPDGVTLIESARRLRERT